MRRLVAWFYMSILAVAVLMMIVLSFPKAEKAAGESADITFSHETGVYDKNINVRIVSKNGGIIKYTVNGDNPLTNGEEYSAADGITLMLAEVQEETKVYPLKAVACDEEENCTEIFQATYVLNMDPERWMDLELISLTTEHKNLYDDEYGLFVNGNWWEQDEVRDAEVASFKAHTGEKIWEQKIGIEISGGSSRVEKVKSLKLIGKKSLGYENLRYDFEGSGSGSTGLREITKYKSLRIRSGSQDMQSGNIRSALVSRLAEASGFDGYSATKRAAVFLNGAFYGVFDVQQNYSDSFIEKRFGLANNDEIEKHKGSELAIFKEFEIEEIFAADLTKAENQNRLEAEVDVEDYLWYYALQILWNNTDWPGNSYEIWRWTGEKDAENKYADGRWRFLIYDTDLIYYTKGNGEHFEGAVGDTFSAIMEGKYRGSSYFPNLMKVEDYKERFLAIMEYLMSGVFQTENVLRIVDEEAEKIRLTEKVYFDEEKYEDWEYKIELLKRAVREREEVLKEDLERYFGV